MLPLPLVFSQDVFGFIACALRLVGLMPAGLSAEQHVFPSPTGSRNLIASLPIPLSSCIPGCPPSLVCLLIPIIPAVPRPVSPLLDYPHCCPLLLRARKDRLTISLITMGKYLSHHTGPSPCLQVSPSKKVLAAANSLQCQPPQVPDAREEIFRPF
jgi:hypothetical protein